MRGLTRITPSSDQAVSAFGWTADVSSSEYPNRFSGPQQAIFTPERHLVFERDHPRVVQFKEPRRAVLEPSTERNPYDNPGQRVVRR